LRFDAEAIFTVSSQIRGNIGCNESIDNDDVDSSAVNSSDDKAAELNPSFSVAKVKEAHQLCYEVKIASTTHWLAASGSSLTRTSQTFLGPITSHETAAVIKRHHV